MINQILKKKILNLKVSLTYENDKEEIEYVDADFDRAQLSGLIFCLGLVMVLLLVLAGTSP